MVKMLTGDRTDPVFGYEVSDKLSAIAEEYRSDNLPITFRNAVPDGIGGECRKVGTFETSLFLTFDHEDNRDDDIPTGSFT